MTIRPAGGGGNDILVGTIIIPDKLPLDTCLNFPSVFFFSVIIRAVEIPNRHLNTCKLFVTLWALCAGRVYENLPHFSPTKDLLQSHNIISRRSDMILKNRMNVAISEFG